MPETEGGTRDRGGRVRFREWRRSRPFAGGVLLMLAGVVVGYVPLQFAFELALVGGSYTFVGLLWAVGLFLTGAFVLYRPDLSTVLGVTGVALSVLSLLGALGGFLLGMLFGIVGGNLCVAWKPADRRDDDGDPPVRTDGGSRRDRPGAGAAARLRDGAGFARRRLARLRSSARRGLATLGSRLRAATPVSPAAAADTGTRARLSGRAAVAVGLLVVAGGALTLAGAGPAAGLVGGDEATYTVDVGEIRLDDGGRICAERVDADTYRVDVTDARLVDVAVYQERDDGAVSAELPSLTAEHLVLYTTGDNEGIERLAATAGCTESDQTSRTVFRSHHPTGSGVHGSEGVTMLNPRAVDGEVPEPGGFRFLEPGDGEGDDGPVGGVGPAPGPVGLEEAVRNATDDSVAEAVGDAVDEPGPADEGGADVTGVANDTEVVSDVEGAVSGAADGASDPVGNGTGEFVDVTEEAERLAYGAVADDENLTELDDGTVLLNNGSDAEALGAGAGPVDGAGSGSASERDPASPARNASGAEAARRDGAGDDGVDDAPGP